jgi:hypothetical protein
MFFGLGVDVKFPANFEKAPYSIIATGVTTLPQKVEFPFSLINASSRTYPDISPAFNEIVPGWVLAENAYALARNQVKFRDRNMAKRTHFEYEALRPDTIDLIIEARRRLQEAPAKQPPSQDQPVLFLESDIRGLGKNYMLEPSRTRAIDTYSFFLRFYALRGLYSHLLLAQETSTGEVRDIESILTQPASTLRWAHELDILLAELPNTPAHELLNLWVAHHARYVKSIADSKARDDKRGARIIPDYETIHAPASEDKVVRAVTEEHERIEKRVARWLKG